MSAWRWLAALGTAVLASVAHADVTYDASSAAEAPLHGGNTWLIEESHGVQRGVNLFHGFERFDLAPGETAFFRPTFPGLRDPSLPPISHVIARVSGGFPSSIRGKILSGYTADLYLLNPAGVVFGPGAALDVNGSFVASSADVLRFGAERIELPLDRADPFSLLAVAPPSSFGFLGADPPAAIRVADAKLSHARRGSALALFGGRLEVERGLVSAPSADLFVAAVRSGDIGITSPSSTDTPRFDFSGVLTGGPILLREAALSSSGIEPPGNGRWPLGVPLASSGAGDVFIRGGDLLGIDSDIFANTNGPFDGGNIDIELDGSLTLERQAFQGVGIFAFSQLPKLVIPQSTGSSGNVRVDARDLSLLGGARISTGAFGIGAAGRIDVDVRERLLISGRDLSTADADESGLVISTRGGSAGAIDLHARDLVMDDFGVIVGETRSEATGGSIDVTVERLEIDGNARIDSSSRGRGDAGDIHVRASESIHISGSESAEQFSGITALAQTESTGAPGSIEISTPSLVVENGGQIATRAIGGLSGDPEQDARRGDVRIDLGGDGRLALHSGGALSVRSEGPRPAGDIRVTGAAEIKLSGGSSISSEAVEASDGGNIELQARERLEVEDSEISASVAGGSGGNISIDPEFVILRNGQIVAQAGTGTGGNIDVTAGLFVADVDSLVSASSRSGIDGTVVIRSPDVDLLGDLAALPDSFVDPANLLADHCAAREARAHGSLTLREFDALPDWPGRLRPSRYAVELAPSADRELQELWSAARAAEQRGDHALALERWEQAFARAATPTLRAAAKLGSAQALERMGRRERALALLDEALTEIGSGSDRVAAAAYALRGRMLRAQPDFERALARTGDSTLLARIHADLAGEYQRTGTREAALRSYATAERMAAHAGDAALGFAVRANRATLYLEAGDAKRAREELSALRDDPGRAPDSHDVAFAALHAVLDELSLEADDTALLGQVERIAEAAARRGDARAGSFARSLQAQLLARAGQIEAAAASARDALLLAQRARAPEAELVSGRLLGRELAALGQGAAAVRSLEAAYTLRAGRFAGIADAETASAAHASWFATAPLLDELVDQLLRLAATTEDPAEHERLLLAARNHLDDGTALALREYFADECVAAQRVVSAAALPDAVVVYPALLPDRVELIVSSPRGIRSVLIGATPDQVISEARRLAELSQDRTTRRYREPAARLYDWLIRPLEEDLGRDGERTLVVVPRGALLRVPWAALYDARRGSHLIEHYALAIVPGLSLAESHPISGEVRALKAGVSEGVQGLPALPAVARELGEISSSYAGPTLLDAGFDSAHLEAALRAAPYGVVHIASHASFGASAEEAYVVTYDGKIGARQLADLVELTRFRDQPLELLTLSACDTSAGDERAALGLAGLAVRAGARSTLGTLWPVNDEAAAELIGTFYRELALPGGSRAGALRKAQLAALAQPGLEHPAYWSPFVMIGSWQ